MNGIRTWWGQPCDWQLEADQIGYGLWAEPSRFQCRNPDLLMWTIQYGWNLENSTVAAAGWVHAASVMTSKQTSMRFPYYTSLILEKKFTDHLSIFHYWMINNQFLWISTSSFNLNIEIVIYFVRLQRYVFSMFHSVDFNSHLYMWLILE